MEYFRSMPRKPNSSPQVRAVLAELLDAAGGWSYGYSLCKRTGIKSGTLYPLLMRLHQQGLLEAEWHPSGEPGRPPRHAYRLTSRGQAYALSVSAGEGAGREAGPAHA